MNLISYYNINKQYLRKFSDKIRIYIIILCFFCNFIIFNAV